MTNVEATHTVDSVEWYTPPFIIAAARNTLGSIDLDPASNAIANAIVKATRYFTKEDDAFQQDWNANPNGRFDAINIFINPPSPPKRWWMKVVDEVKDGSSAIFIQYSIEALQQAQGWTPGLKYIVCIPKRRVPYLCTVEDLMAKINRSILKRGYSEKSELKKLEALLTKDPLDLLEGPQPPHASAIIGLNVKEDAFIKEFRSIGDIYKNLL